MIILIRREVNGALCGTRTRAGSVAGTHHVGDADQLKCSMIGMVTHGRITL